MIERLAGRLSILAARGPGSPDLLARPRRAAPPGSPVGTARHDPDYIVDNLSAVRTNETGSAAYTLDATRMVHYPDNDTTLLTRPRFVSLPLPAGAAHDYGERGAGFEQR